MKTIKTLTTKKAKNLTSFEMLKIVGGENSISQSSIANTPTTNSAQQENQKFSTLSNVIKAK